MDMDASLWRTAFGAIRRILLTWSQIQSAVIGLSDQIPPRRKLGRAGHKSSQNSSSPAKQPKFKLLQGCQVKVQHRDVENQ